MKPQTYKYPSHLFKTAMEHDPQAQATFLNRKRLAQITFLNAFYER